MNVMYTLFPIHAIAESLRNASDILTHAFPEARLWLPEETPHLSGEVRGKGRCAANKPQFLRGGTRLICRS